MTPVKPSPSEEMALFTAALAMPAVERLRFVATACGEDEGRRQSVEDLLRAHDASEDFLDPPRVWSVSPPAPTPEFGLKPDDRIGKYQLAGKIGEGGCGTVYLAEQREPVRRQVALKVIKLGMDTEAVMARFEAEREALSRMDHPNIAHVLDAGTTAAGRPFFVMELVRGIAITEYCDLHRLPTAGRLKLFLLLCRAVEHAHQKGIIHRDLKPANVLVTLHDGEAVPKVIDFGVAKATQGRLVDHTLFTAVEQFVGTPFYMSPEQADPGEGDVDTRTDIYSLGILLYELLTGSTPLGPGLRQADLQEVRRRIVEDDFPRPSDRVATREKAGAIALAQTRSTTPSGLAAQLRGDLDWIVAKALEKDRSQRYATVSALASDLQRHLQNEPVLARPPSVSYRIQKLVTRHKIPVAAALVSGLALALATVVSTWQYVAERRARERAVLAEKAEAAERGRAEAALAAAEHMQREAETARNVAENHRLAEKGARQAAEADRQNAEQARRQAERAQGTAEEAQGRAEASHQSAMTAARDLKVHLYAADLYAAQNLLRQNGDLALVQRILRAHLPRPGEEDLRGLEWNYAWQLAQGDRLFSWRTEQGVVRDLTFSGNGRWLASAGRGLAGEQGHVRIWEAATRRLLVALVDTEGVGFTPDSRRLITVTRDGRVHLWKTETWTIEAEFGIGAVAPFPNQRVAVAVAPLGSLVAICVDGAYGQRKGTIQVYDWATHRKVAQLDDAGAHLAFGHNGRTLVTGSSRDGLVKIWDAETGVRQHQLGPVGMVTGMAVSPDGARLATLSAGKIGTLRVWNLATRQLERALPAGEIGALPGAVTFSPDGELLASGGGDRLVRIWRTKNGKQVSELKGSAGGLWTVAFSPQGDEIFGGGGTDRISAWSAVVPPQENETVVTTLAPRRPGLEDVALLFAPDGKRVVAADWERIIASDTQNGRILARRGGYFRPLWFSPDGTQLLVLNQRARRDARDGAILSPAASPSDRSPGPALESVELLRAADLSVLHSSPLEAVGPGVAAIAVSPDGKHLAATWRGRSEVFIHATATGERVRTIIPRSSTGTVLAFSPDGRELAIGGGGVFLEVWTLDSDRPPWVVAAHKNPLTHIAFSADGRTLATAAADRTHTLWQLAERREIARMGGFDPLSDLSFSPDGKTLWVATGAALKLWHVPTLRDLGALPLHGRATHFALSPDQRTLVYCDEEGDERRLVLVRIAARSELDASHATREETLPVPERRIRVAGMPPAAMGEGEPETAEAEVLVP